MSWFEKMEFPTCPLCKSDHLALVTYGGHPEALNYSANWKCFDCGCNFEAHYQKKQTYDASGEGLVLMTPFYDDTEELVCPCCGATELRMYFSYGAPNDGFYRSFHNCEVCDIDFVTDFRIGSLEIKKVGRQRIKEG